MSGYLRPTAPIAPDALLVADPGLAMSLAQAVLDKPLMANHHHALWGYSGATAAGRPLTVQSTGIGGPSTVAVAAELAAHGVARAIRVGRCATLGDAPGTLVVERALGLDGTSAALGVTDARADTELTSALIEAIGAPAVMVAGFDLPAAAAAPEVRAGWAEAGAVAVDGETAPLLAVGLLRGIAIAAVLAAEPANEDRLVELGERAALAITAAAQPA